MFIELLFATALDLSLPEFQPERDVSGNYIEGILDVSTGEFEVRSISENDVSGSLPALDSQPEELTRELSSSRSISDNDSGIISAIDSFHDDNNNYWELFLDSYPVETNHSLGSTLLPTCNWKIEQNGSITSNINALNKCSYVPVNEGITYNISSISSIAYGHYRLAVVDDLEFPTRITNFYDMTTYQNSYSFTAGQDGYFVTWILYEGPTSFVSSWVTIERESYTLSELGNAVMEIKSDNEETDMKLRIIVFVCLMNFCLPFLINGLRLVMGGKQQDV